LRLAKSIQHGVGMKATALLAVTMVWLLAASGRLGHSAEPSPGNSDFDLVLSGIVTDQDGSGMQGVAVQVFVEGITCAATQTDSVGSYALEFSIDPEADETVAVWWVAPRADLVPELALVRESASDRELGLWGPCVPRIGMIRRQTRSVRLLDHGTFRRELARSGCLD
jgi:hypothetical protein